MKSPLQEPSGLLNAPSLKPSTVVPPGVCTVTTTTKPPGQGAVDWRWIGVLKGPLPGLAVNVSRTQVNGTGS